MFSKSLTEITAITTIFFVKKNFEWKLAKTKYCFTGLCVQTAGNNDILGLEKPEKQTSFLVLGSDS